MPVTVAHSLTATTPDDPLYEIKPSNWNESHVVTLNLSGSDISGAFGNGGGVSFGLSADGKITASAPAGGGGLTNINVSAGTTSNNLSAFEFNNGNGVTFGLNGSTVTASVQTNYLTTAMASNRGTDFVQATAAFAGTNASGTIASNGISVSVGNYITTARASNDAVGLNTALTAGPLAWTVNSNGISLNAGSAAGTTTGFAGNSISGSMTHNTAGLNISLAHPAWLTTAAVSNHSHGFSAQGGSSAFQTLSFSNANNVSFSNSNGQVVGSASFSQTNQSVGLYAVGNTTGQSSSTTVDARSISYQGAGELSVGFSNGSMIVSANVDAISAYAQSNTTQSSSGTLQVSSLNFAGAGGISVGVSNGSVVISGGGGGVTNQTGPNIAAGTQTATSGTVVFSNSNGMVFGMSNNSVVTASYNDVTESIFWRPNDLVTTVGAPIVNSASIIYCPIDHNLSASRFDLIASVNVATAANASSAGLLYSATAVLYTLNGGTLSSVSSATTNNQMTWSSNVTGSVTGGFFLSVPLNVAAAADKYWVGVQLSTRATGLTGAATTSLANTVTLMGVGSAIVGAFSVREPGANTANSNGWFYGMGMYSGTSNFSTIGLSNLTQQGTNAQRANVAFRMINV